MLAEVKVLAMKLETRQKHLLDKSSALRGDVHEAALDCRRFGREEMHRIATRQDARSWSQDLPNPYFLRTLQKLQTRVEEVRSTTEQLEKVMHSVVAEMERRGRQLPITPSNSVSSAGNGSGDMQLTTYESNQQQRRRADRSLSTGDSSTTSKARVGPKQIHRIMQLQMQAFMSITASVADLHRTTNDLRTQYLDELNRQASTVPSGGDGSSSRGITYTGTGGSSRQRLNPFEAADVRETLDAQQRQRRITDILEDGQHAPSAAAQAGKNSASSSSTAGSALAVPALTPTPSFGGFTAAPAPASSGFGLAVPSAASTTTPAQTGFGLSFGSAAADVPPPVPLQQALSFGAGDSARPGTASSKGRRTRK
jgi:hypothetical protein